MLHVEPANEYFNVKVISDEAFRQNDVRIEFSVKIHPRKANFSIKNGKNFLKIFDVSLKKLHQMTHYIKIDLGIGFSVKN